MRGAETVWLKNVEQSSPKHSNIGNQRYHIAHIKRPLHYGEQKNIQKETYLLLIKELGFVPPKMQKVFKILRHIESCSICIEH
jgi:hypothetical protein